MDDPLLVSAVRAAKRTDEYRRARRSLLQVAPADVWRDEEAETVSVSFAAVPVNESAFETYLIVRVDTRNATTACATFVSVSIDSDGWLVSNSGLPKEAYR